MHNASQLPSLPHKSYSQKNLKLRTAMHVSEYSVELQMSFPCCS